MRLDNSSSSTRDSSGAGGAKENGAEADHPMTNPMTDKKGILKCAVVGSGRRKKRKPVRQIIHRTTTNAINGGGGSESSDNKTEEEDEEHVAQVKNRAD